MTRAEPGSLEWEQQHEFLCPDPDATVPCGEKCTIHNPEELLDHPTEENS